MIIIVLAATTATLQNSVSSQQVRETRININFSFRKAWNSAGFLRWIAYCERLFIITMALFSF